MAELWKAGKAKGRLSPPPPAPWKSRPHREIPTFPQRRRNGLEKWKTKNRFSTFPSRFATTTSVFYLRNAAAFGRPGRRFAAHRTPSRSPNSKSTPNRKELFPGLQRLRFSGSSCIGNESRFQDHSSIGICYEAGAEARADRRGASRYSQCTGIRPTTVVQFPRGRSGQTCNCPSFPSRDSSKPRDRNCPTTSELV